MTKTKKAVLVAFSIVILLAAAYFVGSGFIRQGNVYITEYTVSDDGTQITMKVGVSTSAGYVRSILAHQQHGGKLYLDCYSAFGGINGSIGAKDEYTLSLDSDTEMIALYRNENAYEVVLEKDAAGKWQWAN